jgi:hypothetical protein
MTVVTTHDAAVMSAAIRREGMRIHVPRKKTIHPAHA